jgi:hypothetical protein
MSVPKCRLSVNFKLGLICLICLQLQITVILKLTIVTGWNFSSSGTFKLKKLDLQVEGFNLHQIKDKLYFLLGGEYVPLTQKLYEDIMNGRVRL